MRNKSFLPILIVGGVMLAFALIYAVSVDVYDALFWSRFLFGLILIGFSAAGGFSAIKQVGTPVKIRAFCMLLLYALGTFVTLVFVSSAKGVTFLSILLCALYALILFLDAGIRKNAAR